MRHEIIDLTTDSTDDELHETIPTKLRTVRVDVASSLSSLPPAKRIKREHHSPLQQIAPTSRSAQLTLRSPVAKTTYLGTRHGQNGVYQQPRSSTNATGPPIRVQEKPSPQDISAYGHARELKAVEHAASGKPETQWNYTSRPYLYQRSRRNLCSFGNIPRQIDCKDGSVVHVDFTAAEADLVLAVLRRNAARGSSDSQLARSGLSDKVRLKELATLKIPGRTKEDIISFAKDIAKGTRGPGQVLVFKRQTGSNRGEYRNADYFNLLATRRTLGNNHTAFVLGNTYMDVRCGLNNAIDDELNLRTEWTGAAGDVMTLSWTSDNAFIAGATTHSDPLNQQYNKKGNLLLGSVSNKTVRAFPDHRIPRPIVTKGENASIQMVESQSPWLYTSVVFSAYEDGIAYTCGFDNTAKLWNVQEEGKSMELIGTWLHTGKVNYVVPSIHREADQSFRMVATAADTSSEAVRVYRINKDDTEISACQYRTFSASRTTGEGSHKWAYFPATMAWGRTPGVTAHLLLVGYSPRSLSDNDHDIPEDKRNSGELRLWDGNTGEAWKVSTASMCNVFEVAWHPNKKVFAAAVSPSGERGDGTKTQIRLYSSYKIGEVANKVYSEFKCLDCRAAGINYGLTIMPYGPRTSYVAVGCTDGNTYVWDTEAPESTPYKVLRHGRPILDPIDGLEAEDVGVQFVAWGKSLERLYTGSTDGTVKVWNIRAEGNPLVRVLLECKRAVTSGAFSPDKSKLIIGDASGAVYLLTTHDTAEDEWGGEEETRPESAHLDKIQIPQGNGSFITRRPPNLILQHPDPPDPTHDADGNPFRQENASQLGKMYLDRQQLVLHKNPIVGAVQGPRYSETGLYRLEFHTDKTDGQSPLLAIWERQQQNTLKQYSNIIIAGARPRGERGIIRWADAVRFRTRELHRRNIDRSFDVESLDRGTRLALEAEGAELHPDLLEDVNDSDESDDHTDDIDDVIMLSD